MQRVSGRSALLAMLCGLVLTHLVMVTFAAIPPNRYSDKLESTSSYLDPYFTQNWRLFAPNPVSADRSLEFQFAYRDEAGDVVQSDWVDWTSVELDLVRHRIVGGRAGYVTNKMIEALSTTYRQLTTDQRNIANRTRDDAPLSWRGLAGQLQTAGVTSDRLRSYLRYEEAAARLASDVASSRVRGREVVGVRYAVVLQGVTPYAERGGSEAEREAARPSPSRRLSGWRPPVDSSERERQVVADFDARHR